MNTDNLNDKSFYEIKQANDFISMWSIYDGVINIDEASPYQATAMVYKDHWGIPVTIPLPEGRLTWFQLWKAAEQCISRSNDLHHIFIEGFVCNDNTLELITGS